MCGRSSGGHATYAEGVVEVTGDIRHVLEMPEVVRHVLEVPDVIQHVPEVEGMLRVCWWWWRLCSVC